jgi:hypothetical protein
MSEAFMAVGTVIPDLSTGNIAFLRKDADGAAAVTLYDESANTSTNVAVVVGTAAAANTFVYDATTNVSNHRLFFPSSSPAVAALDRVQFVIGANKYSTPINNYFDELTAVERPKEIGALRQGQVEICIVDPTSSGIAFDNAWRLTGATISADLTREPLTELGHLGPYDRPLTLPIPITVTVDSTAGDLRNWAKMAGQLAEYDDNTLYDIDLTDLMNKEDLVLVVKVYRQTDEEAGGTSSNRKALTIYDALGDTDWYMDDGVPGNYSSTTDTERALKTIIVKNLKITDEGMTLDVGANATQTFGFRANNDLFVVKGDVSYSLVSDIARNASS